MAGIEGNTSAATLWDFFGETLHSNVLEEFYPRMLFHDQAQHVRIPANSGGGIHVNAWNKINPVVQLTAMGTKYDTSGGTGGTLLEEWENPDPHMMTINEFNANVQMFGGSFQFTDIFLDIVEIVSILSAGARQLGGGYAEQVEDNALAILLDAMNSGDTNQQAKQLGSSGVAWGSVDDADELRVSDLFSVVTEFDSDPSGAPTRFQDGTVHGIIHPRAAHDLFTVVTSTQPNLVDWLHTTRGQGMFEKGRVPIINGVLVDQSSYNTTNPENGHGVYDDSANWNGTDWGATGFTATTGKGFLSWFFVPGAFANIDLANSSPSLIIQPFGSGGATGDPLKRAMTVGVKGTQTALPLMMKDRAIVMATGTNTTP